MQDETVRITVTCNNVADPLIEAHDSRFIRYPRDVMRRLVGEHGLAYHVRVGDRVVIFDTGGVLKTFLPNIAAIEPGTAAIAGVVLSHGHHDHVGGLAPFLSTWQECHDDRLPVWCHPLAVAPRFQLARPGLSLPVPAGTAGELLDAGHLKAHAGISAATIEAHGGLLDPSTGERVLIEDDARGIRVVSTGEIPRDIEKEVSPKNYVIEMGGKLVHDRFLDDQALIIERKDQHAIVLLGCCHAGLENTMARVARLTSLPVRVIAGGFHLSGAGDDVIARKHAFLEGLAERLDGDALVLRPTHCSGERFYMQLKTRGSTRLDVDRLPLGACIVP